MYVCGMTVYDYCHLGHARVMVAFDVIVRYLRSRGYDVTYVRNITDIDDKIIRRAQENEEDFRAVTERFTKAMHEDAERLGVLLPDIEPCATESMEEIIAMVETLLAAGYAYVGQNADVYYDVSKFDGYGRLSGKRLDELRAGARVEVDETKDDPLDRVLWKATKPGEPSWASPWGPGRPGWDVECSAMSTNRLGPHFDIHGGGADLTFPHHENEIAQSEAATGQPFANVWMHNGHVRVDNEKMSKSLGNFFTVREVLKRYSGEVIRYFLVASHYRSPLNYSDQQLDAARESLTRLYTALRGLPVTSCETPNEYPERFQAAMDDDFNTPEALAVLFDLAREVNRLRNEAPAKAGHYAATLRQLGETLGLLQNDPAAYLQAVANEAVATWISKEEIERLILERESARKCRDWAAADRLRGELENRGVLLEDGAHGTTWRRKQ